MRILLIGEFSRLHNSLKEGLVALGHDVTIIGNGDRFKKYPVDIFISHSFNNWLFKKLKIIIYKIFKINLNDIEIYYKSKNVINRLPEYDIVQLINESAFKTSAKHEIKLLKLLLPKTKKLFLLSCGIDYTCMNYMTNGVPKYSLMSPYLKDSRLKKKYQFQLQYLNQDYKKLHDFIVKHCNGIIASDMDYHLPMLYSKSEKYLGLIPNPINTDKIKYTPLKLNEKIIIFHGVNNNTQHMKGSDYFNEALKCIKEKYQDKIEVITTYSIPYSEYIKIYDSCHILLDQVYGYDQGYNALEAMAKGKVVLTGAEQEWLDYFNLKEDTVAINANPDVQQIVTKLEWLINDPEKIPEISKNARNFIEKEHYYTDIAKKYLEFWKE